MYRLRSTAKDIGDFESTTTGSGIGPYGSPPSDDGGTGGDGGSASDDGNSSDGRNTGGDVGTGTSAQNTGYGCSTLSDLSSAIISMLAFAVFAFRPRWAPAKRSAVNNRRDYVRPDPRLREESL